MDEEIHYCQEIDSKPLSFFFQKGEATTGKKILILGESLAKNDWIKSGRAFYGINGKIAPSGKRLNEELSLLNLSLDQCAITEIAKCYLGSNRKQLLNCGLLCGTHLIKQIKNFKIELVLSLGVSTKEVLQRIFNTNLPIGKITELTFKNKKYYFLPLYHPSPANPTGHKKNIEIITNNKKVINKILKSNS
jgi:uracil-DNA glycosylase family 4